MPTITKIMMLGFSVLMMISAKIAFAETVTYTYDAMQRIVRAQYSSGPAIEYVYDNMGNRTVRSVYATGVPANSPPGQAASPSPANSAVGVTGPLTISWTGSDPNPGDRLSYVVHSGTASNALQPVWSGFQTSFVPWSLLPDTTYYWKVVSRDSHNAETAGTVWNFTTGPAVVNGLPVNLDVSLAGTGTGSITSTSPAGIVCSGAPTDACAQDYPLNTLVTLYAVTSNFSRFAGWSVASCPAVLDYTAPPPFLIPPMSCTFPMTGDMAVSGTFNSIPPIRILIPEIIYYPPLEMDDFASASGIVQSFGANMPYSMTMQSHDKLFAVDVNINAGLQKVLWQGGYSGDYSTVTGTTRIQGKLAIQGRKLIVERISVR